MTIKVKLLQKSLGPFSDAYMGTFELIYPRMIHCFDETTEVLSQINEEPPEFRSFKAVNILGAKVAQYDSGVISFVLPLENIESIGMHTMITTDKALFPLLCTEGHRTLIKKRTTDNLFVEKVIEARDLLGGYGTLRIPQAGVMNQEQFFSNEELALVVWFIADGHKPLVGQQIKFHFRKERKIKSVSDLLDKIGLTYDTRQYGNNFVITLEAPAWVDFCYDENREKVFPKEALQMTLEGYSFFKKALLESDGNVTNEDFNTTSKAVAEQVQMVAILHNDSINLQQRTYGKENVNHKGMYKLTFKDTGYISLRQDKNKFTQHEFIGTVYCVSVPSSFIMVRRLGVVFVTGNCEVLTHKQLSRNCASSRAIPIEAMIKEIENDIAVPIHWGKNQSGMQANVELQGNDKRLAEYYWESAAITAIKYSRELAATGVHKQVANRITEPYQHMKTVMSATDWNNCFYLRNHKDADPTIAELFKQMQELWEAYAFTSSFDALDIGEYHTPYVHGYQGGLTWKYKDSNGNELTTEEAVMISSSCCAQSSFRKSDDTKEKALMIYDRLVNSKPVHASPFEHVATPMKEHKNPFDVSSWQEGITSVNKKGELFSGNLRGWIQQRQLIEGNFVPG